MTVNITQFLSGKPIVFEGFLLKREDKQITFQIYPGMLIDVSEESCQSIEEATDPVSGNTYLRITLDPAADIHATFQPRLARLALSQHAAGVPFSIGGLPEGAEQGPVYVTRSKRSSGGEFIPNMETFSTETLGENETRSQVHFWGWITDDTKVGDWMPDEHWDGVSIDDWVFIGPVENPTFRV